MDEPNKGKRNDIPREERAGTNENIAETLRRLLGECEAKFQALLEALPDLIFLLDEQGRFLFYHTSGPGLYLSPEVFLGKRHNEVMPPELVELFEPAFQRARDRGELSEYTYALDMPDARRWYSARLSPWQLSGRFCGVVAVIREITDRKLLEERLARQTIVDGVTELPNRLLFVDRLTQCLRRLQRAPEIGAALLLLDIDQFKLINDAVGYAGGDEILKELAQRLRNGLRPADTVARLGGDEFAVLLEGLEDETEALRIAQRLAASFARPIVLGQQHFSVTASMGIVFVRPPLPPPEQLLAEAELATARAKKKGAGSQIIYDATLHEQALRTLEIERELRAALEHEQIEVHYQPVRRLADGHLVGYEALVRWPHPDKGLIPPNEFIPIAETGGLICALDHYVCRKVCEQLRQWLDKFPALGATKFWISVNVSAKHLLDPTFVDEIRSILDEAGVAPPRLKIEVTESLFIDEMAHARRTLQQLAELGVCTCIDDFGTGYSALGYLIHLPIRLVKLDLSFVRDIPGTPAAEGIVRTILGLEEHLDLAVLAEGIETEEQLEFLRQAGCRFGQGYLLGKPVPPGAAEGLLAQELAKHSPGS